MSNPYRYSGEYFDEESGLIYLRARYYNPENMRFITEDTYAGRLNDPLTLNLYGYCNENPILYADPSGNVIELSSDATKEQKQAYERAITYLETSATAKKLIKLLMDSEEVFTIVFNNKLTDNYNPRTRTINWDPTGGLVLGDGKSIMSPAMAIVHEMGHAAGVIELSKSYNQKQILAIEEANLSSYETPLQKNLANIHERIMVMQK